MRLTRSARRLLLGLLLVLVGISHFISLGSFGQILAVIAIVAGVLILLGM
jgi:uncharacterized membrane protein